MNINKIIEKADQRKALVLLIEAKKLAKVGKIIELIDLLCPEDTFVSHPKRGGIIKR